MSPASPICVRRDGKTVDSEPYPWCSRNPALWCEHRIEVAGSFHGWDHRGDDPDAGRWAGFPIPHLRLHGIADAPTQRTLDLGMAA